MSKQQRDAIDAALPGRTVRHKSEHGRSLDEADEAIDEVARFFTRHLS